MSFSLLDIILCLGISQGVFLAISLRALHNRNKSANKALSLAIMIAVLVLSGRMAMHRISGEWIFRFAELLDTSIFLFGPLIYLYTRRLLFRETPKYSLKAIHFLPAVIHLIYVIGQLLTPRETLVVWFEQGLFSIFYFLVEFFGILSLLFYTFRSFQLLKRHKEETQNELSYILEIRSFIRILLIVLTVLIGCWLFSFVSAYAFAKAYSLLNYNSIWIVIPVFIYAIGYFSLRQPEIFRIPITQKSKEKARLKPDEIQQLQKRLLFFMQEEQIYKELDLSLKMLAQKLNTSPNNLSWLLNQVYQQTFYDYINAYRVKAVLTSIDRGVHHKQTLLAIAFDAGFNSKSTFNKSFKIVTSQTPSEYIKTQKVA